MSKKTAKTEAPAVATTAPATTKRGRPSNPNSARQTRIAAQAQKRAAGLLHKGRPVTEGSARQIRLKTIAEKRAAGTLRKGRPTDTNSARQQKMAKAAK